MRARRKDGEKGFEPEFVASNPAFGAVAPGPARDRRRPLRQHRRGDAARLRRRARGSPPRPTTGCPAGPVVLSSIRYRARRPLIKWAVGSENWGRQTFTVRVDGKVIGTTTTNALVSPSAARQGPPQLHGHGDRPPRPGRDAAARARSGSTPACRRCRSRSAAAAAGSRSPRSRATAARPAWTTWRSTGATARASCAAAAPSHSYKKGRYTLRVTAADQAGNKTVKSKALRIP